MSDEPVASLAEDEAALGRYALLLADRVDEVVLAWLTGLVASRAPGLEVSPDVAAALSDGAATTTREVRKLLQTDIAEQMSGPLELLRRGTHTPTQVLAAAKIAPVPRDEFSTRNFPDDVYGLVPASFGDIDPSLHEPGLIWGAAKAHVHLRRRREMTREVAPATTNRVVVLSADLMDRSKISAAFPDAKLVRSPARLVDEAADAGLVLVDLNRLDDPSALSSITCRVVAFGSHVNQAQLDAAEAAGAEALPRSVFFRRIETGDL